jgi:ABC-type lipoprotein release transport system permease subunit
VSPFDLVTLISVAVIVLLVATLAALIPAARAAFMQPMRALREE